MPDGRSVTKKKPESTQAYVTFAVQILAQGGKKRKNPPLSATYPSTSVMYPARFFSVREEMGEMKTRVSVMTIDFS